MLAGDKPAVCITEPGAGSAANEVTTRADRDGDDYVLNGGTAQILRTQVASALLGMRLPQTRDARHD